MVLSQMAPCKVVPDGLHAIFYQKFWDVVGNDMTRFVNNIICGRISPRNVNMTNVALISKVKNPTNISDFDQFPYKMGCIKFLRDQLQIDSSHSCTI